ncbi:MAG: efflux RND transporter periplasmic adaptor subunit [Tahibacter sp.]
MFLHRLVSVVAFCALPLALAGCGYKAQSDPRTTVPLVRAAIVDEAASASRSFTGTVAARVQSDLGFRVSGKVLERLVDTGQTVRIGQPLMRIDPVDLNLAAHAQQELVAAAQALARQTASDEDRYRRLLETKVLSASAYDQAKAAADAAKAQLRAVEAQAAVARNTSRYALLVADADGVVMETLVEPGQVVNSGQVVVRIARAGPREAVVQLPETLRPAVGSLGKATLFGSEDAVPITLRQISDAADRLTRTFEARYVLEGALVNAPLGTTVTIQIADGHATVKGGFHVPIGALFDAGKGPGVWVINGEPSKVNWRPVAVQRLDDDGARIAGELKQGDRIVALGAHLLREGEQVRVASKAAALANGGTSP